MSDNTNIAQLPEADIRTSFHHAMDKMRHWLMVHTINPSDRAYSFFTSWRNICNSLAEELGNVIGSLKAAYYTESALQAHGIPYEKVNGIPHIIL